MDEKKETKPTVNKSAVEKLVYNKKCRKLEWDGTKIVAIVLADDTRIEAKEIIIKGA